MTRRNVMITISSSCLQLTEPFWDEEDAEEDALDEEEAVGEPFTPSYKGELPEPTELLTEGHLITTPQRVELVYEESEMSGMEGSVSTIGFDRATPGLVTLMRTGPVGSALVFEQNKRHTSIYRTPFSSFELCAHTLHVENKLLTEGTLALEYILSFHGAESEHCRLLISVKPAVNPPGV